MPNFWKLLNKKLLCTKLKSLSGVIIVRTDDGVEILMNVKMKNKNENMNFCFSYFLDFPNYHHNHDVVLRRLH